MIRCACERVFLHASHLQWGGLGGIYWYHLPNGLVALPLAEVIAQIEAARLTVDWFAPVILDRDLADLLLASRLSSSLGFGGDCASCKSSRSKEPVEPALGRRWWPNTRRGLVGRLELRAR